MAHHGLKIDLVNYRISFLLKSSRACPQASRLQVLLGQIPRNNFTLSFLTSLLLTCPIQDLLDHERFWRRFRLGD